MPMPGISFPRHQVTAESRSPVCHLPASLPFEIWTRQNSTHCNKNDSIPNVVSTCEPWITAFLIVDFDLDKGQVVQACVPHNVLSYAEKEAICFYAMPDSAAGGTGHEDAMYTFRVTTNAPGRERDLLLAHTLFRQAPDRTNPRGFFQKAVVVVTSAPFVTLASVLLSSIASKAFQAGEIALLKAVEDISAWPDPRGHIDTSNLELPFAGDVIKLSVPQSFLSSFAAPGAILVYADDIYGKKYDSDCACLRTPDHVRMWPLCSPSADPTSQPFHEINVSRALRGVHDNLWKIWELVITGEPLLVLGATPSQCASAVLAIIGLIHPFPFVGDWHPYFCIQDHKYSDLVKSGRGKLLSEGAVYGVTNSHLVDTLAFKHVLVLPGAEMAGKRFKAGLRSSYRSSLHKARRVTNAFTVSLNSSVSGAANADELAFKLRQTVYESLTKPFLHAFRNYLVPRWSDGLALNSQPHASDPFDRRLTLKSFAIQNFPTQEDVSSATVITLFKGPRNSKRRRLLYKQFMKGPVFQIWWREARTAAEINCVTLHRQMMLDACMSGSLVQRAIAGYANLSDLLSRIENELQCVHIDDAILAEKLETIRDILSPALRERPQV